MANCMCTLRMALPLLSFAKFNAFSFSLRETADSTLARIAWPKLKEAKKWSKNRRHLVGDSNLSMRVNDTECNTRVGHGLQINPLIPALFGCIAVIYIQFNRISILKSVSVKAMEGCHSILLPWSCQLLLTYILSWWLIPAICILFDSRSLFCHSSHSSAVPPLMRVKHFVKSLFLSLCFRASQSCPSRRALIKWFYCV